MSEPNFTPDATAAIELRDEGLGRYRHLVKASDIPNHAAFLHLHPDWSPELDDDGRVLFFAGPWRPVKPV